MSLSKTQVCNLALSALGHTRINNIEGTSEDEVLCKQEYEHTRDQVLRRYAWTCAVERARLARLEDDPITTDFTYQYEIPGDCLRILETVGSIAPYRREGQKILTNDAEVYIRYIKRIENPTYFDSLLLDAIVTKLAIKLCPRISNDKLLKEQLKDDFKEAISEARRTGVIEEESYIKENTELIDAGRK